MTLFDLRKKIEGGYINNAKDEWNKGRNEVIRANLHYLLELEKEIESRVSQLEKLNKNRAKGIDERTYLKGGIDELCGVLGKNS